MFATLAAAALALAAPTAAELRANSESALSVEGNARLWFGARPGDDESRLVFERGGVRRILAAPESPEGIGTADLGTDADGGLVAVFATCPRRRDCDVHAVDADDPAADPRPLRFAARRGVDETAPTIHRGRVAWATGDRVFLRSGGRTRRVRRALPRRADDVVQLELTDGHLAARAWYVDRTTGDFGAWLVRLDGRTLFEGGGGLSGKHPVGLSFAEGKLGFHVSCPGEPGVCAGRGGAFGYDPATDEWEQAPHRITGDVEGFQLLPGDRALVTRDGRIEEVALPFAPSRSP